MYLAQDTVNWTCGLGVIGNYSTLRPVYSHSNTLSTLDEAGTGFYVAGFIDTVECKAMYDELIAKFPIVYQSPVRQNVNSGNDFFFCVFDVGQPVEEQEEEDDEPF